MYLKFYALTGCFLIASLIVLVSCSTTKTISFNDLSNRLKSLDIHEGLLSESKQRIKYKKDGVLYAVIDLSEPVLVSMAQHKEEWGYFQFPYIGRGDINTLIVGWSMKEDSPKMYGKQSDRNEVPMMSKNGGRKWRPQDRQYRLLDIVYHVTLDNGDVLQINTPQAKNINNYDHFPKEVGSIGNRKFYLADSLPNELKGIYFNRAPIDQKAELIHASLYDDALLRYANNDLMPIVWWGDIKQLNDHSLLAGAYPTFYYNDDGTVSRGGVTFYKSEDEGLSWYSIGKIPVELDKREEQKGCDSFEEPTFEFLSDSTIICIMRTGASTPMYRTFSNDLGRTWTKPEPFTPNGVKPRLMRLKNGALVLISGRPGVQLRLCLDEKGYDWSEPIDMIPFMHEDGSYTRDVSCGYVSVLEDGKDSFYMVYSNFISKNTEGEVRKSIWCRKVRIKLK